MKIWIDFINSPQVSFFDPLIGELGALGHEFILTCRDSSNTVQLLDQRGWPYRIVGDRVEKGTFRKALAFPRRIGALYAYLKGQRIDVAICQSSFYLPLTATLLGVPSIYTNDNEHALGNIPGFLFANRILIPENLSVSMVVRRGGRRGKVIQYPGVKEGVYLWAKGEDIHRKRAASGAFSDAAVSGAPGTFGPALGAAQRPPQRIFVRPEPLTAQYYSGKLNFLDDLLSHLKKKYPVSILVRDKEQLAHYTQPCFSGIDVPARPLAFEEVASTCLLFIGAGGSMTREMAILGVPTISVYQGDLLAVDKFLIGEKMMVHTPDPNVQMVEDAVRQASAMDSRLIDKGKQAYALFKHELLNYSR